MSISSNKLFSPLYFKHFCSLCTAFLNLPLAPSPTILIFDYLPMSRGWNSKLPLIAMIDFLCTGVPLPLQVSYFAQGLSPRQIRRKYLSFMTYLLKSLCSMPPSSGSNAEHLINGLPIKSEGASSPRQNGFRTFGLFTANLTSSKACDTGIAYLSITVPEQAEMTGVKRPFAYTAFLTSP